MPRVIITVPEQNPQPYRFQLDRMVVSIGRGSDNDIVVDSGSVSSRHAEMHRVEGGYELADVGSTNGIKYNESRQQIVSLRSGMSVKLGDVSFDFSLTEEELEVLARERPIDQTPVTKEPAIETPLPPAAAPRQRAEPRRRPAYTPVKQSSGGGFGSILVFLILAAAAFYAGMEVRYRKDPNTADSLYQAIMEKIEADKAASKPGQAVDTVPAEVPPAE
ncbi:FHA domain-containing protein [Luteolibacter algae]|uniref:FHA domain-containing protein n=1 Tax=Luteolibacter algae TaxID=454151 RepID=A0ABW5D8Z9_9BACT